MAAGVQEPISHNEVTLSPFDIAEAYRESFKTLYGKDVDVQYIYNKWYTVNGETVHRITLMQEITRLQGLIRLRNQSMPRRDKNMVNRLISRLRGL